MNNALKLNDRKPAIPWIIETPGFFRKRRLKILAERIDITPFGDLLITLDTFQERYIGLSRTHTGRGKMRTFTILASATVFHNKKGYDSGLFHINKVNKR